MAFSVISAPPAVHPSHQNRGVGGDLVNEVLRQLKESGVELVFELGYPGDYRRYGFTPARANGFESPYPLLPEHADALLVHALQRGVIGQVHDLVTCADTLDAM